MRHGWIALLLLSALPLWAQDSGQPSTANPDDKSSVEPFESIEVGGPSDGAYLPLALGRDRTGWGLRARMSIGWDSNIYKVAQDDDSALFGDAVADAYFGANLGMLAAGVRGLAAGRLYFGEPDADMWDVKLGGFLKMPYADGGWGAGVSADVLYQQLQTYEIASTISRQDDLRASGTVARAHLGYAFSIFVFEAGLHGQNTEFSEEGGLPSNDSWQTGIDLGLYMRLAAVELRPWVDFSYEWFREQRDRDEYGQLLNNDDALQLLEVSYGLDFAVDLSVIEIQGRAYARRQDDSAAGFERWWQYGLRGAADLNLDSARVTFGLHLWTREYDKRPDIDSVTGEESTTFERYSQYWGEVAVNVLGPFSLGVRAVYTRRISTITGQGFEATEILIFAEISF